MRAAIPLALVLSAAAWGADPAAGLESGTLPAAWLTGGPHCVSVPEWLGPGHHAASIALYVRRTGNLLTGDSLYPGRLYVNEAGVPAYAAGRVFRGSIASACDELNDAFQQTKGKPATVALPDFTISVRSAGQR